MLVGLDFLSWFDIFDSQIKDYDHYLAKGGSENVSSIIQNDLEVLRRKVLFDINRSILSGEYVECPDRLRETLARLTIRTKDLLAVFTLYEELQGPLFQIVNTILLCVNHYKAFCSEINNRYSTIQRDYLFVHNPQIKHLEETFDFSADAVEFLEFLKINLKVASFDHHPSAEVDRLVDLQSAEFALNNFGPRDFGDLIRLLQTKIRFLKFKWLERQQVDQQTHHFVFLADGREEKMDDDHNDEHFKEWVKYIKNHYQISPDWKTNILQNAQPLLLKNYSSLTTLELHLLIKYFKDVSPNLLKLTELSRVFQDKVLKMADDESAKKFDDYAAQICFNYADNNRFSLFLADNPNVEKIESEYQATKSGRLIRVNNFFPEKKYLKAIIPALEKIIERDETLSALENLQTRIEYNKSVFDEYSKNFNWSIGHHNYVFQLPFDECCLKIGNERLFVASSVVLAVSNSILSKDYNDIKQKWDSLQIHASTIRAFQSDLQKIEEVKGEIAIQKQEIKNREIKSLEVLGVFTAIVTFVLGSLSGFKFITTVWQSLLFIGTMGTSLLLFVFGLFTLNRGIKTILSHKWLLISMLFLATIYWGALIKIHDSDLENDNQIRRNNSRQIDSLFQAQKKINYLKIK